MENIKRIWPKWEAVEIIGKGGFGTVYKAKRENFGEVSWAAIKVVKIPNDEAEMREMTNSGFNKEQIQAYYHKSVQNMISEIRLMEKMKSASHIVGIEDFEVEENATGIGWTVYIRMELLTNLTDYLSTRQVTVDEVKKMAIHILTALEFCHKQNLIHRDIKPGNIFVSSFGEYKLGDFGISREVEKNNATLSQKGTKSYMAPEMIRLSKYGRNVDLYALGLTMYELLNHGRMPFLPPFPELYYPNDREEAMLKRLTGEVFPEIEGIGELNRIIQRACHYDPTLRYQTASEMKNDLLGIGKIKETVIEDDEKTVMGQSLFDTNEKTMMGQSLFNDDDKTVVGEFLFDKGEDSLIKEIKDNDEGTLSYFNETKYLFEDSTSYSSLRDVLLNVKNVKENNAKEYYVMVGDELAYLVFTNGYYAANTEVICNSTHPVLLKVKELYQRYIKTTDISLLKEMVQMDQNAQLYMLLGDTNVNTNKEEAYHCYRKAYDLDSQDARVLKRVALMLFEQGEYETAMTVIKEAINNASQGICSGSKKVLEGIYFVQALIAQKMNDEALAVRSISEIYKFNYMTVASRWSDYRNAFYDISRLYKETSQQQYLNDLYMNDHFGRISKVFIGGVIFNIGGQLFDETLTELKDKATTKNIQKKIEKTLEKLPIPFETIYYYHAPSLSEKFLYGKYGVYWLNKNGFYYLDYYRLPLFYLCQEGYEIYFIKWEDRYVGKFNKKGLHLGPNFDSVAMICRLRGKLIEHITTPLNTPIEKLGFHVINYNDLKRANISTVEDLLEAYKYDPTKFDSNLGLISIIAQL